MEGNGRKERDRISVMAALKCTRAKPIKQWKESKGLNEGLCRTASLIQLIYWPLLSFPPTWILGLGITTATPSASWGSHPPCVPHPFFMPQNTRQGEGRWWWMVQALVWDSWQGKLVHAELYAALTRLLPGPELASSKPTLTCLFYLQCRHPLIKVFHGLYVCVCEPEQIMSSYASVSSPVDERCGFLPFLLSWWAVQRKGCVPF